MAADLYESNAQNETDLLGFCSNGKQGQVLRHPDASNSSVFIWHQWERPQWILTWIWLFKNYLRFWASRQISLDEIGTSPVKKTWRVNWSNCPPLLLSGDFGPLVAWDTGCCSVLTALERMLSPNSHFFAEVLHSLGFPPSGSNCKHVFLRG